MISINAETIVPIKNVLFVFALEAEAAEVFVNCNTLITGLGKVNATYALTQYLQNNRPALIINLGSAGSSQFEKGSIVCCNQFIQRDMDVRGLGYTIYETPLSGLPIVLDNGIVMDYLPNGICGSGDSFEMEYKAAPYNVVDMEAYALALVALKENIPFMSLKYISDGADDNAADDWNVQVHNAALAYGKVLQLIS